MEDFSSFIHEEIFLINTSESIERVEEKSKVSTVKEVKKYALGVIAIEANEDDKELLNKILTAISIAQSDIHFSSEISAASDTWIVFSESLNFVQKDLQHFTISNVSGQLIITSKTLETLRNSVEDKGELWSLLKKHFNS